MNIQPAKRGEIKRYAAHVYRHGDPGAHVDRALSPDNRVLHGPKTFEKIAAEFAALPERQPDTKRKVQQLNQFREVPLPEALDLLGLWWKRQRDFRPRTDPATQLLLIKDQFELTMTHQRFVLRRRGDRATLAAGYGAIDLAAALIGAPFRAVVKRLQAQVDQAAAPTPG